MQMNAEGGEEIAAAPAEGGDEADGARADAFKPFAGEGGRETEDHNGDGKDPDDLGEGPVVRGAGHHAPQLDEGRIEDAPGIGRADAEVDGDRGGGNGPTVEGGGGGELVFCVEGG